MRLFLSLCLLRAVSSFALLRVPSASSSNDRPLVRIVKHVTAHCDDKTDRNGNNLVFPPQGIVHGLASGGDSCR